MRAKLNGHPPRNGEQRLDTHLAALLNVGAEIVADPEESNVLRRIVGALVHTLGYKSAYFRLLEPDGSLLIYSCEGSSIDYAGDPNYRIPIGVGVIGSVVLTRQPRTVVDLRQGSSFHFTEMREREGFVGMMVVPLLFKGDVLGALSCYTGEPHVFSEDEIQIVTAFANLAAVALSNARHVRQLRELHDIGNELAKKVDLDEVLSIITQHARRIARADGAFLCLYDADRETFELDKFGTDGVGWTEALTRTARPRHNGISMTVLREGIVRVEEVASPYYESLLGAGTQSELLRMGIQAFLGWRLSADAPVGVLYLNYAQPDHIPTSQALQSFETFATQAATAIQRARLFDRRRREQSLLKITARITATVNTVENTWGKFLQEAMRLTGAKVGNISIISQDRAYLDNVVASGYPDDYHTARHRIGGHSIQGWVAKHKQSVLIRNVKTDEDWKDVYHAGLPSTLSELTVPIYRKRSNSTDDRQVLGIINLEHPEEAAFGEADLRLLEWLCVHAKIAIQVAGDYEQLEKRHKQLEALMRSAKAIGASLELRSTLQAILHEAAMLTGAHYATIQEKRGESLFLLEVYPPERWRRAIRSADEVMPLSGPGITVQAAREARSVIENDVLNNPIFVDLSGHSTRSELVVPMLSESGQIIGVLNVEHTEPGRFDQDELIILEGLARLAVVAFHNAKQYEELKSTQLQLEEQKRFAFMADFTFRLWHRLHNQLGLIPPHALRVIETLQGVHTLPAALDLGESIDSLETIRVCAREAIDTVETIRLPFSTEKSYVNVRDAIREAAERIELPDTIEFNVELDDDVIMVDASSMLSEVFKVLITNALDAMPSGGRLNIRGCTLPSRQVELVVQDNGRGIPEAKLAVLRQFPLGFTTKKRAADRVQGGLGLGLWWVNQFLRRIGGEIMIDSYTSGTNRGSSFTVRLPTTEDST